MRHPNLPLSDTHQTCDTIGERKWDKNGLFNATIICHTLHNKSPLIFYSYCNKSVIVTCKGYCKMWGLELLRSDTLSQLDDGRAKTCPYSTEYPCMYIQQKLTEEELHACSCFDTFLCCRLALYLFLSGIHQQRRTCWLNRGNSFIDLVILLSKFKVIDYPSEGCSLSKGKLWIMRVENTAIKHKKTCTRSEAAVISLLHSYKYTTSDKLHQALNDK